MGQANGIFSPFFLDQPFPRYVKWVAHVEVILSIFYLGEREEEGGLRYF